MISTRAHIPTSGQAVTYTCASARSWDILQIHIGSDYRAPIQIRLSSCMKVQKTLAYRWSKASLTSPTCSLSSRIDLGNASTIVWASGSALSFGPFMAPLVRQSLAVEVKLPSHLPQFLGPIWLYLLCGMHCAVVLWVPWGSVAWQCRFTRNKKSDISISNCTITRNLVYCFRLHLHLSQLDSGRA